MKRSHLFTAAAIIASGLMLAGCAGAEPVIVDPTQTTQPAPAPRFSRTKAEVISSPALVGEHSEEILKDLGLSAEEISSLKSSGGIA